jgi:glycosyltransferase involved in cell wall biosynthesis
LEDHISSFALPISNLSPLPDKTGKSEPATFESRADVEKKLTTIWMEILGAQSIARDQDFFDIGGESNPAIHLVTQMGRRFNAALNASLVFEARTIESQADFLKSARFTVMPSTWYETFGMCIAESFACGTPVICSRLGAMAEIVADRRTGLHFNSGDAAGPADKVSWAWTHPEEIQQMARAARQEFESRFTPEKITRN